MASQISVRPFLAVRTRLELATPGVTGRYSNQLNYRTNMSGSPNGIANIDLIFNYAKLFLKKLKCTFPYFFSLTKPGRDSKL